MPLYSGATPPRSQACTVPTLSLPASLRWRPNHSQCTDNQMEAQARYYSQVPRAEKSLVGSESISSLQSLPKTRLIPLQRPWPHPWLYVRTHASPRKQKTWKSGGARVRVDRLGKHPGKLGSESGRSNSQKHLWESSGHVG